MGCCIEEGSFPRLFFFSFQNSNHGSVTKAYFENLCPSLKKKEIMGQMFSEN